MWTVWKIQSFLSHVWQNRSYFHQCDNSYLSHVWKLYFNMFSTDCFRHIITIHIFGNGSFRPLSCSPWVVSPRVVSPPSRFALYYVSRFALLPWVVSPTTWWVVSPKFWIYISLRVLWKFYSFCSLQWRFCYISLKNDRSFVNWSKCILFNLTSLFGDKDVIWDFSLFYNDLLNILQFSWTLYVFELVICLGIIIGW